MMLRCINIHLTNIMTPNLTLELGYMICLSFFIIFSAVGDSNHKSVDTQEAAATPGASDRQFTSVENVTRKNFFRIYVAIA